MLPTFLVIRRFIFLLVLTYNTVCRDREAKLTLIPLCGFKLLQNEIEWL